ncbi:LysR substrate-binding domain-containing protein [Phenylobacterium aquaticum]|uniref:LysR substrate-binding domain-containing protein n=1 Tax=Phenylobacterium aquaticum TaxID=1763816 RepID=UPI001F5C9D07|nr:LysR substrate-binding domain-containing protein [Phenylobacterium aquaticum]MCI3133540.1 LysR substrate-binding domain-containing protein [Phenylobacterium aquaticum]
MASETKSTPINRRWLPLNALRAFDAVGQNLSFTAGAQALHVSQSALSRHVISLEDLLGRQLLDRRPHRLALTEAGAALLPVVRKSFDRLEQALNAVRSGDTGGRTLRVHMPPSLLQQMALPMLRDFRREFPDVLLDVSSSHVTGLPREDLDVAIVYDRPSVDDRVTDLLWMVRVSPVCSPEVAEQIQGQSLTEALKTSELLHVKLESEPRGLLWGMFVRQFGLEVDTDRGLAFDTAISAVQYAMSGGGVALADIDMFAQEIADGKLVRPFEAMMEDGYGYYLKFHAEDLGDPAISLFRSWVLGRFAAATGRAVSEMLDI